jgi:hypothetical protein
MNSQPSHVLTNPLLGQAPRRARPVDKSAPPPTSSPFRVSLRVTLATLLVLIVTLLWSQSVALAAGGTMTNGGNYTGSISGGQQDQWTFSATKGDMIRVTVSELGPNTGFVPVLEVHNPDSTLVSYCFSDLKCAVGGFTATQTGTYTALVYRQNNAITSGQYQVTFVKSPGDFIVPAGDEGGPILDGASYAGSLLRGDMDPWSFYANQGDSVRVTVSEAGNPTGFIPLLEVHAPNGALVTYCFSTLNCAVGQFAATQTGTYTAWVERQDNTDGVGQYLLTMTQAPGSYIIPAGDEGGQMTNGGTYAGSLLRGDMDQWTFTATKGDSIRVTVTEGGNPTGFVPLLEVHAPSGALVTYCFNATTCAVAFTATQTGTYYAWVERQDNADGVGQYLLNLSGGSPLPAPPGLMVTMATPQRVVDTRLTGGPIASGTSRCFTVAGLLGIPANAGAVVLNVTAVGYGTNGWLTIYPNGGSLPDTSTVNFDTHEYAIANGAVMRIGNSGQVCVNVGTVNNAPGSAQVILDATGYLTPTGLVALNMLPSPLRLVDTRLSAGPIGTGTSRCFTVAGLNGIPANAAALVVNLTAVNYATNGWLTLYPNGQPVPATSSLNFDTDQYAVANGAIVRIGTGGQVCINTGTVGSVAGGSDAILDVTGFITSTGIAQLPMLLSPQRVVDTRTTGGGAIPSGTSRCFTIAGLATLPAAASSVVLNVTAVGYSAPGWLTVFDPGHTIPATSTVNFDPNEYAVANLSVIALDGGDLCVNVGTVGAVPDAAHVIIDVVGYQ